MVVCMVLVCVRACAGVPNPLENPFSMEFYHLFWSADKKFIIDDSMDFCRYFVHRAL